MGLLRDFLARGDIDGEAATIAGAFMKRVPKERATESKHFLREFEILVGQARGYQRKKHLGVYGKARLGNTIQWMLINAGYDERLARKIGRELSVALAADRKMTY